MSKGKYPKVVDERRMVQGPGNGWKETFCSQCGNYIPIGQTYTARMTEEEATPGYYDVRILCGYCKMESDILRERERRKQT